MGEGGMTKGGRPNYDPLNGVFPWWLGLLREADYDLSRVPEGRFLHVRDSLALAGIVLPLTRRRSTVESQGRPDTPGAPNAL
jgi:hypothetical protein